MLRQEEVRQERVDAQQTLPREADDVLAGKREAILAQAPKREGDYFVVRKIIETE